MPFCHMRKPLLTKTPALCPKPSRCAVLLVAGAVPAAVQTDLVAQGQRCLQALSRVPEDTIALLLAALSLTEALQLPASLLRPYLRNWTVCLSIQEPRLTASEACRLASHFHNMRQLGTLRLRMCHAHYDPLLKRTTPSTIASRATPNGVEVLAPALPFLLNLQELDLSDCAADATGTRALAEVVHTMPQLTHLAFARNGAGAALTALAERLSTLPTLAALDLSQNAAPHSTWCALVGAVGTSSCLSSLVYGASEGLPDARGNVLEDSDSRLLPEHDPLTAFPSARKLLLSGVHGWAPALGRSALNSSLCALQMQGTALDAATVRRLMTALSPASALSTLSLTLGPWGATEEGGIGTPLFPASSQWPQLQALTLHSSGVSDSLLIALLNQLPPLPQLSSLATSFCGSPAAALPASSLSHHSALSSVSMTLTGRSAERSQQLAITLWSAAMHLAQLTALHWRSPELLEDDDHALVPCIKQCSALVDIRLDCVVGCELLVGFMHLRPQLRVLHVRRMDLRDDHLVCFPPAVPAELVYELPRVCVNV